MTIPKEVKKVILSLEKAGFKAYVVGGCTRDFLQDIEPNDWDIATSARPEEIQKIFPDNFYENAFLTVTILTKNRNPRLKEIEITTFRSEAKYTDKRHPDEIRFAKTLKEDLARRDFTINAIALKIPDTRYPPSPKLRRAGKILDTKYSVNDPFNGQKDLKDRIIRAVGDPNERFNEDALRLMRAARLATALNFKIEPKTKQAIIKNASLLKLISKERIRDEFIKTIMTAEAAKGIELLHELGLLEFVAPELEEGINVSQNKHHTYNCWDHNVLSLDYAAKKGFGLEVRLASLFHDIGKPRAKRGQGPNATFYNHEVIGARMAQEILERLKFPRELAGKIVLLVRYHLFYYNVGEVGESSVRRLVRNVGLENFQQLLEVRMSDRIGSGVPKAEPYKLRHLKYMAEKVSQDPLSAKMLKVDGNDVMEALKIKPGPKVGQVLSVLLELVIEDPKNNKKDYLKKEISRLGALSDKELGRLAEKAEREVQDIEQKKDEMTKEKYWVT
ncbi:MAG: HDIG domain-containing protein [bacterium]|nr:HDIG domain-containing protein [bacterium]